MHCTCTFTSFSSDKKIAECTSWMCNSIDRATTNIYTSWMSVRLLRILPWLSLAIVLMPHACDNAGEAHASHISHSARSTPSLHLRPPLHLRKSLAWVGVTRSSPLPTSVTTCGSMTVVRGGAGWQLGNPNLPESPSGGWREGPKIYLVLWFIFILRHVESSKHDVYSGSSNRT